jgi:nitrite reductase/ring-hydroxylating ferredoxin subunit/uncharacterized membrane protein
MSELAGRVAQLSAIDAPASALAKQIRAKLPAGPVKDALSGSWLGHALHPLLTDVPIGAWTSAGILDLVGGRESRTAAQRLIATGLLAAGPTAISGWSDWADTEIADDAVRRIGIVHAVSNISAIVLYAASYGARRSGAHGRGVALGAVAAGALGAGGYFGGDLSYARGVGVDNTAFDIPPADWTDALGDAELAEGALAKATVGDVDVVLARIDGQVHALADKCAHRGGPLSEGKIVDGCVECPWHFSRFRLSDGSLERGPSAYPQPAFEVRARDGRLEVRPVA